MAEDVNSSHIRKYQEAIGANSDELAFQSWFCKSDSLKETRVRGFWDFAVHILTPKVVSEISYPEDKTALEIGYGGGRILNAAAKFFGKAIGVDIHKERLTLDDNVTLLTGDGTTLPVEDSSIDFVYSFIVFLHLQSFNAFISYLKETHRVLKPHGVAQLYFGLTDESFSFREVSANHASLSISMATAQEESRMAGFKVIDSGKSYKSVPNGYPNVIGQQGYVTLKK